MHLSVIGYLEAAYRALPVGSACTCLAGWDPDETIWLGDVLVSPRLVARWNEGIGRNGFSYWPYWWLPART